MSKDVFANHRTNGIIIAVLIVIFISVIYFPKSIWDYETELSTESRFRMNTVTLAEKMHYQLAKAYTTDTEQLVFVVNSVRDSLLAAENDTNYNYYGDQLIAMPGKSIPVNYSDTYLKQYNELHMDLFNSLEPHHYMGAEGVSQLLDSMRTLFEQGNYVGAQSMEIDSVALNFLVSEKYDILYQNIKTSMFNALTGSYTKYPNFSNPLVDAVMDSLTKNPDLNGRTDFTGIYDGPVRVDFIIPFKFEENLEKSKLALKKQFIIDPYDSTTYGDTLYNMALSEFMSQNDTSAVMPEFLTLMYTDTSMLEIEIPVEVKVEDMFTALAKRRNLLYTMLTGYSEPSSFIADYVISVALDSMGSPDVGIDSIHLDIDLSDALFNINIHNNIRQYFHKVSLEQAYYKTFANLSDLDIELAAVEIVESVAASIIKKSDFKKWQVVEGLSDTFYVNVYDEFLRAYDEMNLILYQTLTGEFTNIHDYAAEVVGIAAHLSSVDSLDWSGSQTIEIAADTVLVNVFPQFMEDYSNTFSIARDTVVHIDDSTFIGVWKRFKMGVTQEFSADSLDFLVPLDNSEFRYDFFRADSALTLNVLEKGESSKVEKVFFGPDAYVMIFSEDSVMENIYRITDEFSAMDSIQIDSLSVVSSEIIAGEQEKYLFMSRDSFGGWLDTTINKKYVKQELFNHYLLRDSHTRCSVTNLPFRITVRNNVNLAVESPIVEPIETSRYLFFTQLDSSHGRINDGEASWSK